MKFSSLILAAFAAFPAIQMTAGYDIGCLYPDTMPDPIEARSHIHLYSGSLMMTKKIETPVIIHLASLSSLCHMGCLAYHDESVLDPLTKKRPLVSIPTEYHNAWSQMLCIAQCFAIISYEAQGKDDFAHFWEKWGLEGIGPRRDSVSIGVAAAQGNALLGTEPDVGPLETLLQDEDYHPFTVGNIVASEVLLYTLEDGWNPLGALTYDIDAGEPVPCTANCEHYKDTIGYFPRNQKTGKAETNETKYIVNGTDKYWQPLIDNDGQGFFSAQLHVTPHIGYMAKPKLWDSLDDIPETPDPAYDYYEEALAVIERLRETASDPIKKQKVAFFDNKLLVLNFIEAEVRKTYQDRFSFQDELLYIEGFSAGEHDATIMAWREKLRHDLVRPTTVIQRWGSDILNTFGGDKTVDGPVDIAARDFQAFQRVMPHSEYPSGSSCICTAYTEFTDAWTTNFYNENITDLQWGQGTGYGCDPEMDPPLLVSIGCDDDFVMPDMKTMLHQCSQSRLWAGFHFEASVVEGEKLCAGVGYKAFDHVEMIRNGSTLGQKFYKGDSRPQCSDPNYEVSKNGVSVNGDEVSVNGDEDYSSATKPVEFWTLLFAATAPLLLFFAM